MPIGHRSVILRRAAPKNLVLQREARREHCTRRGRVFFTSAAKFHQWLEKHHTTATELWMSFYKKCLGKPSIIYQDALGEALCFGWIDGTRKTVEKGRHTIHFTPRKPTSNWSNVNIKRVHELS